MVVVGALSTVVETQDALDGVELNKFGFMRD